MSEGEKELAFRHAPVVPQNRDDEICINFIG